MPVRAHRSRAEGRQARHDVTRAHEGRALLALEIGLCVARAHPQASDVASLSSVGATQEPENGLADQHVDSNALGECSLLELFPDGGR